MSRNAVCNAGNGDVFCDVAVLDGALRVVAHDAAREIVCPDGGMAERQVPDHAALAEHAEDAHVTVLVDCAFEQYVDAAQAVSIAVEDTLEIMVGVCVGVADAFTAAHRAVVVQNFVAVELQVLCQLEIFLAEGLAIVHLCGQAVPV